MSIFKPGGRPGTIEAAAKTMLAMADDMESRKTMPGLLREAQIGSLCFQAELLNTIARELRAEGDVR